MKKATPHRPTLADELIGPSTKPRLVRLLSARTASAQPSRKRNAPAKPRPISPRALLRAYQLIPELSKEDLEAAASETGIDQVVERADPWEVKEADLFEVNEALREWVADRLSRWQITATGRPKFTPSMRARKKRIVGRKVTKGGKRRMLTGGRVRDTALDNVLEALVRLYVGATEDVPGLSVSSQEGEIGSLCLDWIEAVVTAYHEKIPPRLLDLVSIPLPTRQALAMRLRRLPTWNWWRNLENPKYWQRYLDDPHVES